MQGLYSTELLYIRRIKSVQFTAIEMIIEWEPISARNENGYVFAGGPEQIYLENFDRLQCCKALYRTVLYLML